MLLTAFKMLLVYLVLPTFYTCTISVGKGFITRFPVSVLDASADSCGFLQDTPAAPAAADTGLDDLLGGLNDLSVAPAAQAAPVDDLFGLGDLTAASAPAAAAPATTDLPMLLDASAGHGCSVRGKLVKDGAGQYAYRFWLQNSSPAGMSGFHVQFNKNALGVGLAVGDTSIGIGNLTPGQASETQKQVSIMPDKVDPSQGAQLQIALKWTELAAASPFVMIQVCLTHLVFSGQGFQHTARIEHM